MERYREKEYPDTTAKIRYSLLKFDSKGEIIDAEVVGEEIEEVIYLRERYRDTIDYPYWDGNVFDEDGNLIQIQYG